MRISDRSGAVAEHTVPNQSCIGIPVRERRAEHRPSRGQSSGGDWSSPGGHTREAPSSASRARLGSRAAEARERDAGELRRERAERRAERRQRATGCTRTKRCSGAGRGARVDLAHDRPARVRSASSATRRAGRGAQLGAGALVREQRRGARVDRAARQRRARSARAPRRAPRRTRRAARRVAARRSTATGDRQPS